MPYTIKQLATLSGVTVRTLHHYDALGLLKPSHLAKNGYRQYEQTELFRLQQILFFRELDFPLSEIKRILENSRFNPTDALTEQRKLLQMKQDRLKKLMKTIDKTLTHMQTNAPVPENEMYGSLSKAEYEQYREEVKQKWGEKELKQSQERIKNWTKEDWKKIGDESAAIAKGIAEHMNEGVKSPAVQAFVEQQFAHINRFYDCTLQIFRGLGEMYVNDPRFAKNYTKYHEDLPVFMRDAMAYFCDMREKKA